MMRLVSPFFCESTPARTLFEEMKAISIPEKNAEKAIDTSVIIKAVAVSIAINLNWRCCLLALRYREDARRLLYQIIMQNNSMPKVSVIIPVYSVEKYIERCARSLFEQTLTDIEYIFVDDCSPDNSINILESVLEVYPNRRSQVKIIRHLENKGLPAARKTGIDNSTGDYIIHCDSDDWVETDMYRLMYDEAKRLDADIVMCGYKVTDGQTVFSEYYHKQIDKTKLISSLLTLHEAWSFWNKMCKRTLYDNEIVYPS